MANLSQGDTPIISASAGNFGQGLAHAASRRGRRLIISAATNANPLKFATMCRLGAEVILTGADLIQRSWQHGSSQRNTIEDEAESHIAEGASTIAREITEALSISSPLSALFVPIGNSALLTGTGTWMREIMPGYRIVGVVAEAVPAMKLSQEQDAVITTTSAPTMADGIAVRVPVAYVLHSMRSLVDEVVVVEEDIIEKAMQFRLFHCGLVVEPAGLAGIAALLSGPLARPDRCTILCGGNV
jgi:threonine dehydratase